MNDLRLPTARGFSLIELLVVIVALAIAGLGIATVTTDVFVGQTGNARIQNRSAQLQECAELILSTRQKNGYSHTSLNIGTSTICNGMTGLPSGDVAPTVSIAATSSATWSACPHATSGDCKLVTVSQGVQSLTLLLAK